MKYILNRTKSSQDRFTLIDGSMGSAGDPEHWPTHKFEIANGVDKGNGYQGYMNITYALKECSYFPEDARKRLIWVLSTGGYKRYLEEIGVKP